MYRLSHVFSFDRNGKEAQMDDDDNSLVLIVVVVVVMVFDFMRVSDDIDIKRVESRKD